MKQHLTKNATKKDAWEKEPFGREESIRKARFQITMPGRTDSTKQITPAQLKE